jgi:ATP-dependent exoDNAse (exonuclease V) beta subunit
LLRAIEPDRDGLSRSARSVEFPVVIIPEVQASIGNRGASRFLADEQDGLDVRITELQNIMKTESPTFWGRARIDRTSAVFEEMRVFYVAVTRAQNHVVLVGADTGATFSPGEKPYGWQDEVLAARAILKPHGVVFEKPPK